MKCNCFCFHCKNDLIAINNIENKRIPHFRHRSDVNCSSSFESYVHWLTKEIFNEINILKVPKISFNNLNQDYLKEFEENFKNIFEKEQIPTELRFGHPIDKTLYEEQSITFENCFTEQTYQSQFGECRIDIVLEANDKKLLIEPYLTNKIDHNKFLKISDLDYSTLEIDLNNFISNYGYQFSQDDLKNFLQFDISSKKWIHIKTSISDKYLNNLLETLEVKLKTQKIEIDDYRNIRNNINLIKTQKIEIENQRISLRNKINLLDNNISEKELKLIDYRKRYFRNM